MLKVVNNTTRYKKNVFRGIGDAIIHTTPHICKYKYHITP